MKENLWDDSELLEWLDRDPAKGITMAIECFGGAVKSICTNILGGGSQPDIEECIADCFVKLWQSIDRFDEDQGASLRSYVYGIARHTALSRRRQQRRDSCLIPIEENEIEWSADFCEDLTRKTNQEIVQRTVDQMPPPDREIFIYRYFFFEPVKRIAQRLGMTPKAVENKLYRGRERLKKQLLERGVTL